MELRHLFYFKTVAEELHFRNAAKKLFISQPPLSRQIKELEEELEVTLFTRTNKNVTLTDAGKYFKKEVDEIFSRLEESKHHVKQIHGSVSGQLRIGYISSTYQEFLINILKELHVNFPFVKTSLYEVPTVKQVRALEEGKLDIGIIRAPVNSEKLQVKTLFDDPFVLVAQKDKAVFKNETELRTYLKAQEFVFFNKDYAPYYFKKFVEICQRLGFYPNVVHEANNVHSILRLVEKGLGISIVPASLKEQYSYLNISFHNLNHTAIATEVVLAYRDNNLHPATEWLIERLAEYFSKE
ncbi:LysR family transcriptional regulator [Rubrolithibacter danxiaensis]|uniref:LysR family transcriptional regulator n=1 Tax=Rubrolithibacter danxiaensis TaxID=3390805 RepID=UPI003BF82405